MKKEQLAKNKRKILPRGKKFEEFYFEGYYKGIGDFSKSREQELSNWFDGMLSYINQFYPIKRGRGKKLIEFGCATGAAANLFADYGFSVTSTDVSNYSVSLAKKNYSDINFGVHDMQKLYTGDKNFDVAVAFDVVEHLKDPEVAISNTYKILRNDGVMILTTPNDYKHISNDPTHINVKTPKEWGRIIKKAGFKEVTINQVTFIPYLYRFHHLLNIALPIASASPFLISPVFVIAKK